MFKVSDHSTDYRPTPTWFERTAGIKQTITEYVSATFLYRLEFTRIIQA